MEVPPDYIIEMLQQTINARMDSLEKKMDDQKDDVTKQITEVKTTITDTVKDHETRIKDLEQFKYKAYATSGGIAFVSGIVWNFIFK